MIVFTPYILPLLVSVAILLALGVYAWQYRSQTTAAVFGAIVLALLIWTAGFALEIAGVTLPAKIFWANVQFTGITALPVAWLALVIDYTGRMRRLKRLVLAALVIPLATNIVIWTNEWHHLFRQTPALDAASGPFTVLVNDYGPWFYWIHAPYGYLVILASMILLVRSLVFARRAYRRQILVLLLSTVAPLTVDALYVAGITPIPNFNFTPVAFSIFGLIIGWNLFRYRFLDLAPIARSLLVETMDDALIVIDRAGRIADVNPAAQAMVGALGGDIVGQPAAQVLAQTEALHPYLTLTRQTRAKVQLRAGDETRYVDLRAAPLRDRRGKFAGQVILLHDISAQAKMEQEREQLIRELQHALAQVKTLRGLLPICANCKKIRDDQGYWHSVEVYVHSHSEAEFTHSICPDCLKKLYPDQADQILDELG
ncbi:MAG: histidine kinase N-terminal 7TM domain-containing protein [Anaerolineae bacterium]